MNVVVLAEQLRRRVPGGIGTYIRGILDAAPLSQLSSRPLRPGQWSLRPWASGPIGRPVRSMRLPSPLATRAIDHGWLRWPTRIDGRSVDVAHATSLLVPQRRRGGPPTTAFVHDLAWRTQPDAYPKKGAAWHEAALGRALARADRFLVPSVETANALLKAGAEAGRIHIAAEGCDHLPLKQRSVGGYLLSVATVEPRKNLRRILDAYALSGITMPLKLVGPSGWGPTMGALPHGVQLVGAVSEADLAELYAGAQLLAYVPLEEGFGLPAVEAMRAGCPVVASMVPSVGDAAHLVDPLDVASIAHGLRTVMASEARQLELTELGRAHTAALTWSACLAAHEHVWGELCRC